MLALLFPGQGSQYVGMGRELAQAHPAAARTLEEADDVLGFSLSGLMVEGPEEELRATRNAQPAILAHSIAALRVVEEELGPASVAAGHSLGEFSAHVAAGTFSFADGLRTVRARGELMHAAGQELPGTMAAILGLSDDAVREVCGRVDVGTCVPANFNTDGQTVVSGDVPGVERGMELAREAGAKRTIGLNVSGAFHSPLMEPAVAGLREILDGLDFFDPAFPVMSNVTAAPVVDADAARGLLVKQITSPVAWSASVRAMVGMGAQRFVELGPGSVLAGLNRRNAKGLPCLSIGEPADLENVEGFGS